MRWILDEYSTSLDSYNLFFIKNKKESLVDPGGGGRPLSFRWLEKK